MVILWLPFQGHESYLLSLLSENNKCDSISEYTPNHGTQTYGSPTEWFNQDVGLDLRPKYFIGSLDGDHKIIWSKVFEKYFKCICIFKYFCNVFKCKCKYIAWIDNSFKFKCKYSRKSI